MSIEAFGTRRVTESLKAIAKYVDDGAKIARGIQPSQVLDLDLKPAPVALSPRITSVLWELDGGGTASSIHLDDLDLTDPDGVVATVDVAGSDLLVVGDPSDPITEPIMIFKLVGQGSSTTHFEAFPADISTPSPTGFTANLHLVPSASAPPPPVGSYDALVVNALGQAFLLANAVSIEASDSGYLTARTTEKGSSANTSAARRRTVEKT